MDIQQLCAVLQGCLSANPDERKAAEALLKQVLDNASNTSAQLLRRQTAASMSAAGYDTPTHSSVVLLLMIGMLPRLLLQTTA
jgi:hypothetical protein